MNEYKSIYSVTGQKNKSGTFILVTRCVNRACLCCLSEVLGGEHALGPAQDGVLGRVVRMLFGRDLQHGRDRLHVGVDGMTDHLGDELVNQDDADVVTRQKAPGGRKMGKTD